MGLAEFRERRADAKRTAVLKAARRAFASRGLGEVSTAEIAAQAGVSTATLYRHFATKADLFAAVVTDAVGGLRTELAGQSALEDLCLAFARLLCDPEVRGVVRAIVAEAAAHPDMADRFYQAGKSATADLFAAAVSAEVAAGRASADADAGQLMGMIEHSTLVLGLLAGNGHMPSQPSERIAREALKTWRARFGR